MRKVLKGIATLHPASENRAKPLQLAQVERLTAWLDGQITGAQRAGDARMSLSHLRNRALMLLGFWRGFRSDELSRLCAEHVVTEPGRGMTLFLPRKKGDRAMLGTTYKAPALSRLCPVAAYEAWITVPEYAMRCLNKRRTRYELVMPFAHGRELAAAIEDLLAEIHSTAELCNCMAEMVLHDPVVDAYWH